MPKKEPRLLKFVNILSIFFIAFALSPTSVLAEQITVIGDSHSCGDFGQKLVKNLSESGKHKVVMYCAGGLSTQHWLKGFKPPRSANNCHTFNSDNTKPVDCLGTGELPALEKILKGDVKPNRVVVALGSNNLGMNAINSFESFAKQIKDAGVKCQWVGPPTLGTNGVICQKYGHNLGKVVAAIKSASENACEYIDSRDVTSGDSTSDCIHRYGKPARDWADGVTQLMNQPKAQAKSSSKGDGAR